MSKHPIPDWLRSQFSRIEDEVHKLGPCGVFTQMRTVTQTYFEQAAAAPQPPALGGEAETLAYLVRDSRDGQYSAHRCDPRGWAHEYQIKELIDRAHLAPLQAENKRLELMVAQYDHDTDHLCRERDHLKARNAELEGLSSEASEWIKANSYHGTDAIDLWQRIDAALSEPADQQGEPFFYALCGADGKPHFDDFCVASEAHHLECEEEGVTVVPVYLHAQPATAKVVLPEGDDIPDFSPGNGNKARRRAEALKKSKANSDYDEFDNGVD